MLKQIRRRENRIGIKLLKKIDRAKYNPHTSMLDRNILIDYYLLKTNLKNIR